MIRCPNCSLRNAEDARFCFSCGTPMAADRRSAMEARRGASKDSLDLVGLAFLLLIVGVVFIANPNLIGDASGWVGEMVEARVLMRPPDPFIGSAILFFALVGLSDFGVASLRFSVGRGRLRILADVLAGVGLLAFAYFLTLYANQAIPSQVVLAAEATVVGVLLLVYIILALYWARAPWRVPKEAKRPATRE